MRAPNLWVVGPALIMGVAGAVIGRSVARASCAAGHDPSLGPVPRCPGTEWAAAAIVGVVVFVGVLVVAVLVVRSFAEWRQKDQ